MSDDSNAVERAYKRIMTALQEGMADPVNGVFVGFVIADGDTSGKVIFSSNGHDMRMGRQFSEALLFLMKNDGVGPILTSACAAALQQHRPEWMVPPDTKALEMLKKFEAKSH